MKVGGSKRRSRAAVGFLSRAGTIPLRGRGQDVVELPADEETL